MEQKFFKHATALVESEDIGAETRIWAFAHVLKGARIGKRCNDRAAFGSVAQEPHRHGERVNQVQFRAAAGVCRTCSALLLCRRNIEMTPLCQIEVTHPRVLGFHASN